MANFDIKWDNVNQSIDPLLTQSKSYADVIGGVGTALDTFAKQQKAQNNQNVLMQILQSTNPQDLEGTRNTILDLVNTSPNSYDGSTLLGKVAEQGATNLALSDAADLRKGTEFLNKNILGGNSLEDIQSQIESQGLSGKALEPFLTYKDKIDAQGVAKLAADRDYNLKSIDAANKVQENKIKMYDSTVRTLELIAKNPDKKSSKYFIDPNTNQLTEVTETTPGMGRIYDASGLADLQQELMGGGASSNGKAGTKSAGGKVSLDTHHDTVKKSAESFGWSPAVVAGFLGNFEAEGGYTGASGDGGNSHGIAQWFSKDRQNNFTRVIGKSIGEATVEDQMLFVKWEMDNPKAAGMSLADRDRILAARTPTEAAELIDKIYERSTGEHRTKRKNYASDFYNTYYGSGEGSSPIAQATSTGSTATNNGPIAQATTPKEAKATQASVAKAKNLGVEMSPQNAAALTRVMPDYKSKIENERKVKLNAMGEAGRRVDMANFLAQNKVTDPKDMGALSTDSNSIIYRSASVNKDFKALSAEDKKVVLSDMFAWGKDKTVKPATAATQIDKAILTAKTKRTTAEKSAELNHFVKASVANRDALIKGGSNITLDQVQQIMSPFHYKALNGKDVVKVVQSKSAGATAGNQAANPKQAVKVGENPFGYTPPLPPKNVTKPNNVAATKPTPAKTNPKPTPKAATVGRTQPVKVVSQPAKPLVLNSNRPPPFAPMPLGDKKLEWQKNLK